MTKKQKRKWKEIYKGNIEDFDLHQSVDYWQTRPDIEVFQAATELILNVLKTQGREYKDVSRLLRTTAVIKRQ